MLAAIIEHLWQSTLFGLAAGLLAFALRRESAQLRYWVWLAASVKFLIPLAWLTALGRFLAELGAPAHLALAEPLAGALQTVAQPFTLPVLPASSHSGIPALGTALIAVWACGSAALLLRWWICWRRTRTAASAARALPLDFPIEARVSADFTEPGVFGVTEPLLLLPEDMAARLSPEELRSVLAHEYCHVRRRDNLTGALHMLVEALFWFHPLVWWIGARLLVERERACDEEVIDIGHDRIRYAESILKVCRMRVAAEPAIIAAAAGADLRQRIEHIVRYRPGRRTGRAKKLCLATLSAAFVSAPVAAGVSAPERVAALAQAFGPLPERFSEAYVEPSRGGETWLRAEGGQLSMRNTSLRTLIGFAYGVRRSQVHGGPEWLDARFDIEARADVPPGDPRAEDPAVYLPMIQELFAHRFNLIVQLRAPVAVRCRQGC